MRGPISWCGEDLARHQAVVAVLAWAAYGPEWSWASSAAGVPLWALTLAAAGHDAGKALPCIQQGAVRACKAGGGKPSFRLHEYASGYALAALSLVAQARGMSGEALGLAVASLAALLHHHGMAGRLEDPLQVARGQGQWYRPGAGRYCGHVARESVGGLGVMLDSILEACREAAGLAGAAKVDVEACPSQLQDLAGLAASRPPSWSQAWRHVFEAINRAGARARAAVTVATAAVSVADTLAAAGARGGLSLAPASGACRAPRRYAVRLLCENPQRLEAVARALEATAGAARP